VKQQLGCCFTAAETKNILQQILLVQCIEAASLLLQCYEAAIFFVKYFVM